MRPSAGRCEGRTTCSNNVIHKPIHPFVPRHPPQLWEISSGELLLSVLFDVGIMAVTLDLSEYHIFCGGMDGSIFQVDLCAWVSDLGDAS